MSSLMSSAGSSEVGSRSLNQRKKLPTSSWPLFLPFTSAGVFSDMFCGLDGGRIKEQDISRGVTGQSREGKYMF